MKTRFYTGTGDKGESVFGKIVLPKSDPVFEAMGSLDELNAIIGFCRVEAAKKFKKLTGVLFDIQENLFIIQAEIAAARFQITISKKLGSGDIFNLERIIDELAKGLSEIKKFQIPGGSELSVRLDIARTVCRRAERAVVKFRNKIISFEAVQYLNRLSSLLFVMSRYVNRKLKIREMNPKY